MKYFLTRIFFGILFSMLSFGVISQTPITWSNEGISTIIIGNINGNVDINSNSVANRIKLNHRSSSANAKDQIKSFVKSDSLIIYIDHPCTTLNLSDKQNRKGWKWGIYDWKENCNAQEVNIDLSLNLPEQLNIEARTINDGHLKIIGIKGSIAAYNINGDISIARSDDIVAARTINGDLSLSYSGNPKSDADLYSLNGDIEVYLNNSVDAFLSFKSNYGDMFTDFDDLVALPSVKEEFKSSGKTKIKLEGYNRFQMGSGGRELRLETFNGDVMIKTARENH